MAILNNDTLDTVTLKDYRFKGLLESYAAPNTSKTANAYNLKYIYTNDARADVFKMWTSTASGATWIRDFRCREIMPDMIFEDHFIGTALDITKWHLITGTGAIGALVNGKIGGWLGAQTGGTGIAQYCTFYTDYNFINVQAPSTYPRMRFRTQIPNTAGNHLNLLSMWGWVYDSNNWLVVYRSAGGVDSNYTLLWSRAGVSYTYDTGLSPVATPDCRWDFITDTEGVKIYCNDIFIKAISNNQLPTYSMHPYFGFTNLDVASHSMAYDYVKITMFDAQSGV